MRWKGAVAQLGKSEPEQDEEQDPQEGQSVGSVTRTEVGGSAYSEDSEHEESEEVPGRGCKPQA